MLRNTSGYSLFSSTIAQYSIASASRRWSLSTKSSISALRFDLLSQCIHALLALALHC